MPPADKPGPAPSATVTAAAQPRIPDQPQTHHPQWIWTMPTVAVLVFIVAMAALLWMLQRHELDQQRNALMRDAQWAEQTIHLHLHGNQEMLVQLAKDLAQGALDADQFLVRASQHVANNPELSSIVWIGENGLIRWASPFETTMRVVGEHMAKGGEGAYRTAREWGRPVYSTAFPGPDGDGAIEIHVPMYREGAFIGTIAGVYSVQGLLQHLVPGWFAGKYRLSIVDAGGQAIASSSGVGEQDPDLTQVIQFNPPGNGLGLRVTAFRTGSRLAQAMLIPLSGALALVMLWSLWMLKRHVARRVKAEDALRAEHNFRRAMEDSVLTGLRATDMEGRITYVNPAFCRIVGWSEKELLGARPPFPYWVRGQSEAAESAMAAQLAGSAPSSGFDLGFRRRSGETFDARLFVSPLIDGGGRQNGWMASMYDITEAKRAREDLKASHERFVAVLEGLDAAVHVADMRSDELLFVNRSFKNIFGHDVLGKDCWEVTRACHPDPAAVSLPEAVAASAEVPIDLFEGEIQNALSGRWYHVRDRAIKWVDGRTVRMEMATDITERKRGEELNREHQARLQHTSRLITMGEMASSLAHELNQPLSAIANYSSGCVKRLLSEEFRKEDVLAAMQKASFQAERAGKIVRRMRNFVRKSEPQRVPADIREILEEAVGFAEIDARKLGVRIRIECPASLPRVSVDPIMIEQVALNLVKNAAEAMQATEAARREVTVTAAAQGRVLEVRVLDRGHGIGPEQAEKLFAPFYTTKPEGMGMGLNICRSIVEFHGGRLWVTPNPEGGSIFHVTLPMES